MGNKNNKPFQIKRKPANRDKVKVGNGEKIKLYLAAENSPPGIMHKSFSWNFADKTKAGGEEMESVLVEASKCFCGENMLVSLKCFTKNSTTESKISFLDNTINYFSDFEMHSTQRTFYPQCNVLFGKEANLCFQSKIYMTKTGEGEGAYYEVAPIVQGYIEIYVEGLNNKRVKAKVQNRIGSFKTEILVYRNNMYIPFVTRYAMRGEEETDILSVFVGDSQIGQGGISYRFNLKILKNKTWTQREIDAHDEVLVVGYPIKITDNNFHPCKFTEVELREKVDSQCIFLNAGTQFEDYFEQTFEISWRVLEESAYTQSLKYTESDGNNIKPFAIIAGNFEKNIIVLVKDFETKKCAIKTHKQEVTLDLVSKRLVQKISGLWETEVPILYKYSSNLAIFMPLDCFFPFKKPQKRELIIASCRRTLTIPIMVYPDIQWAVAVHFAIGKNIMADKFKDLFKLDKLKSNITKEKAKNSFEISLAASWDNADRPERQSKEAVNQQARKYTSIYINVTDLKQSVKKGDGWKLLRGFLQNQLYIKFLALYESLLEVFAYLDMFRQVMKMIDFIESKTGAKLVVPNTRKKWTFELILPNIDLAITWRCGVHKGKGGFIVEGTGRGNFIGLKARFDMFSLASKMPQLRLALLALDVIEYLADIKFRFDLLITGTVMLRGQLGYDAAKDKLITSLAVVGRLMFTLELSAKVTSTKNNRIVTKEYGVNAEAGFTFTYTFVPKDDGLYSPLVIAFTGLTGSVYSKITVTNRDRGHAADSKPLEERPQNIITKTFMSPFDICGSAKKSSNNNDSDRII